MTESQNIVKWNEDRNLIKTPQDLDITTEMSFILEEVIEVLTPLKSEIANPIAKVLAKAIKAGNVRQIETFITANNLVTSNSKSDKVIEPSGDQIVDGCSDMKVFATGTTRKAGYDPDIAMEETQKEIDSRVGEVIDGKFRKDKSPEAQANWYTADYNTALI